MAVSPVCKMPWLFTLTSPPLPPLPAKPPILKPTRTFLGLSALLSSLLSVLAVWVALSSFLLSSFLVSSFLAVASLPLTLPPSPPPPPMLCNTKPMPCAVSTLPVLSNFTKPPSAPFPPIPPTSNLTLICLLVTLLLTLPAEPPPPPMLCR